MCILNMNFLSRSTKRGTEIIVVDNLVMYYVHHLCFHTFYSILWNYFCPICIQIKWFWCVFLLLSTHVSQVCRKLKWTIVVHLANSSLHPVRGKVETISFPRSSSSLALISFFVFTLLSLIGIAIIEFFLSWLETVRRKRSVKGLRL